MDEERLRSEFHQQTAKIAWHDLQPQFARGVVVLVAGELDLVQVAVQLQVDNKQQFQQWIDSGLLASVSDNQAREYYATNPTLWAVVAPPWVLVQEEPALEQ